MPPLAIVAGLGVAGSIGGALIGANAANNAANTQAGAADYAAGLQYKSSQDALDYQKQKDALNQKNLAPWLSTGQNALGSLGYLLGVNPNTSQGTTGGTSATGNNQFPSAYTGNTNGLLPPANSKLATIPDGINGDVTAGNGTGISNTPANSVDNSPTTGTTGTGTDSTNAPFVNTSLGGYGSLLAPWTGSFTAPTDVTEQNDPGFQFRLAQGQKALQASAAAHGNLLSGGQLKALTRYNQDYSSNEYGNVYNRALGEYQQKYNTFKQNQNDEYNKLANIAGLGQTAAGQLSSAGQSSANNVSNILLGSANSIGNSAQNAGAARASGYVGSANAISNGLQSGLGSIGSYLTLASLLGNKPGSPSGFPSCCWVATALYGKGTPDFEAAKFYIYHLWEGEDADAFRKMYAEIGPWLGKQVETHPIIRETLKPVFDEFVREGQAVIDKHDIKLPIAGHKYLEATNG